MAEENNKATSAAGVATLVEGLSASSRRHRQEMSQDIAAVAAKDPSLLAGHIDALIDALDRPEAQTRWEVLGALSTMTDNYADQVSAAFDGAEASLFDDDSATVRLAAFLFLCRLGSTSPERSNRVWPLLDEAIQCYHGDAEYRDMLEGLLGFVGGSVSKKTAKALAARVKFDAESGSGYIKQFSGDILATAKDKAK
ncbi:hypothetical protein [Olsenella sp. Marseille-P4559]|uniref:hypothetical protein n=1 Tax=Olsenella sp. Marseille-P4559 TaxID=2364795 RepID=UPI0010316BBA|nr:hypothetical protein [Olsenella sp. Marseille-P4559]